jgi:hypothetical protein
MEDLKILNLEVDDDGGESYFRVLVNSKDVKYITIDFGIYDTEDMTWDVALIPKLPDFPLVGWNFGHITKDEKTNLPHFSWTAKKPFPGIEHTWHPVFVDYLSLNIGKKLLSNVYEATTPRGTVIVKYARFPWEIDYYNKETEAYFWIEGHEIGPKFLGHVTEGNMVIGFLLQKVDGHHASGADLEHCRDVVKKLHTLGIHHRDLNKHNFLVQEERAYLIDFESARKGVGKEELNIELESVEGHICSESKRGGMYEDLEN